MDELLKSIKRLIDVWYVITAFWFFGQVITYISNLLG